MAGIGCVCPSPGNKRTCCDPGAVCWTLRMCHMPGMVAQLQLQPPPRTYQPADQLAPCGARGERCLAGCSPLSLGVPQDCHCGQEPSPVLAGWGARESSAGHGGRLRRVRGHSWTGSRGEQGGTGLGDHSLSLRAIVGGQEGSWPLVGASTGAAQPHVDRDMLAGLRATSVMWVRPWGQSPGGLLGPGVPHGEGAMPTSSQEQGE